MLTNHSIKKIILLFLLIGTTSSALAQQYSYDFLVSAYCQRIRSIESENMSKMELQKALILTSQELGVLYKDTTDLILKKLRVLNQDSVNYNEYVDFTHTYIHTLVNNCRDFVKYSRRNLGLCPTDNPTLQYVTIQINQFISFNTHLPDDILYKKVNQKIIDLNIEIMNYAQQDSTNVFNADYKYGIIPIKELLIYLAYKSDSYFKLFIISESEKLLAL